MALLGGTEHEGLVHVAEVGGLGLSLLEPGLQLLLGHLEVTNVRRSCQRGAASAPIAPDPRRVHTPIQQGNLARLLVRNRESVLEAAVAVTELIPPPLLRLDALAADLLAAHVVAAAGGGNRVEVVVVVAGEVVGALGTLLLLLLARGSAGDSSGTERVEAVRPGDGRERTRRDGGAWRVGTAAAAATARADAVGRQVARAQVRERTGVDTRGREGASGRAGAVVAAGRRVGVLVKAAREVEGVEATRRRSGRHWVMGIFNDVHEKDGQIGIYSQPMETPPNGEWGGY